MSTRPFLVADKRLYKRLCPSVRWSVGWSVVTESKSGKTPISAPAHPSATGIGCVSGLASRNSKEALSVCLNIYLSVTHVSNNIQTQVKHVCENWKVCLSCLFISKVTLRVLLAPSSVIFCHNYSVHTSRQFDNRVASRNLELASSGFTDASSK